MAELIRNIELSVHFQASILKSLGMNLDHVQALQAPMLALLELLKEEVADIEENEYTERSDEDV